MRKPLKQVIKEASSVGYKIQYNDISHGLSGEFKLDNVHSGLIQEDILRHKFHDNKFHELVSKLVELHNELETKRTEHYDLIHSGKHKSAESLVPVIGELNRKVKILKEILVNGKGNFLKKDVVYSAKEVKKFHELRIGSFYDGLQVKKIINPKVHEIFVFLNKLNEKNKSLNKTAHSKVLDEIDERHISTSIVLLHDRTSFKSQKVLNFIKRKSADERAWNELRTLVNSIPEVFEIGEHKCERIILSYD